MIWICNFLLKLFFGDKIEYIVFLAVKPISLFFLDFTLQAEKIHEEHADTSLKNDVNAHIWSNFYISTIGKTPIILCTTHPLIQVGGFFFTPELILCINILYKVERFHFNVIYNFRHMIWWRESSVFQMPINPPCHFILFDQFSLHSKHFCAILLRNLGWEHKREEGGGERKKPLPANLTILKNYFRPRVQLLICALMLVLIE